MPQMAPMLWCILFLYFILLMMVLMKFIFFEVNCDKSDMEVKLELIKLNWKW
uniref:ATP synthase complex subunit 8 n=1 Tax=Hyalella cajasi TaxID=2759775 RepID=A0A7T8ZSW3_9CRUS|nr:ATP synthase F0 subunit 8 [Hyalella cajasi]